MSEPLAGTVEPPVTVQVTSPIVSVMVTGSAMSLGLLTVIVPVTTAPESVLVGVTVTVYSATA